MPVGIRKEIRDITDRIVAKSEDTVDLGSSVDKSRVSAADATRLIADLQKQMKQAAKRMEFERAAMLRDEIVELRNIITIVTEEGFAGGKPVFD